MPVSGRGVALSDTAGLALDVPILVYHRVTCLMGNPTRMDERMTVGPEAFARQMESIKADGYTPVSLSLLGAALETGTPLPPKPVVLTFDDGWISQYTDALPVLRRLGFSATFFVFTDAVGTPGHVSWDQVREMRSAGMEIGSHTVTHAPLPGMDDWPMWKEVAWSKDRIEHELDAPVDLLAYPFGECDERVIAAAKRAGYRAAVTTDPGDVQKRSEVMRLHRVFVGFMDGPDGFAAALQGERSQDRQGAIASSAPRPPPEPRPSGSGAAQVQRAPVIAP